ncbi:MAG: hypothetical protein AAF577_06495 [Pseudomonadota bacterium]
MTDAAADAIRLLRQALQDELGPHFEDTAQSLPGHTRKRHASAVAMIDRFTERLIALPVSGARDAVEAAVATLFSELNALNQKAGGRLLETEEREMIVPFVIDAAATRGCDHELYEDGDITIRYRKF